MLLLPPMFKAGLVLKRGPTDNVFDAIRKGYPVQQLPGRPVEIPATVGQQEASAVAQQVQAKLPEVVSPGPQNTCPPGYTFALGYCVRDVNYYGCIPGVEFWDGTKCSRNWPKCAEGITNDLNTGECIGQKELQDKLNTSLDVVKDVFSGGPILDSVLGTSATTEAFVQGTNETLQNYLKNEAGKPTTTEAFITDTADTMRKFMGEQAPETSTQNPLGLQASSTNTPYSSTIQPLELASLNKLANIDTTVPTIDTTVPEARRLPELEQIVLDNPYTPITMADGTIQFYNPDRQELYIYNSEGQLESVNAYIPVAQYRNTRGAASGSTLVEVVEKAAETTKTIKPRVTREPDTDVAQGSRRRR